MAFTLAQAVPWGRNFDEYKAMFALSETDLEGCILGCSDGPASFNAELTARGGHIVSADPLYQFAPQQIRTRIDETYNEVMQQTRNNQAGFIWKNIKTVDQLGDIRMAAMDQFLNDYAKTNDRYICAELPILPFADKTFDLALCSHFLFLYSELFCNEFHTQAIQTLCRVAREVRIFPLLELNGTPSRHLQSIQTMLDQQAYSWEVRTTDYEFQKGGNQMLQIHST